jgi:hypothetical protein
MRIKRRKATRIHDFNSKNQEGNRDWLKIHEANFIFFSKFKIASPPQYSLVKNLVYSHIYQKSVKSGLHLTA